MLIIFLDGKTALPPAVANLYGQNQKAKRPYSWVVINTKDEEGKNRLVLLELSPEKENVEIVHWYYLRDESLETIKRQAEREGGHILILPSESSEEAGGLSSLTPDLSSAGKVTEKENSVQTSIANAEQETETTDKAEASNSIRSAFDNLKKQASDRMLIFKEGGNYEILYEDAKKAAEILELPVQKKDGKTFVSFPIKDLDENLPLLIRRGVTVAITEALREGKRLFSELEKTF